VSLVAEVGLFCLPSKPMGKGPIAAGALLAATGLFLGLPARAQVTSYMDDHGKRIYINAVPSAHRLTAVSSPRRPSVQSVPVRATVPSKDNRIPRTKDQLDKIVTETAARHRLDARLVRAVIEAESGWNPMAVSNRGALGLMQLIPATAERFGVGDVFDPAQNVEGGVRYLGELLERYQGDLRLSLAAYHAGEGAVDRAGGVPNYPDTRAYVRRVSESYFRPGSLHSPGMRDDPHPIYQAVDDRGQVVFTNE
jgi:soluble lytic murein transglycosylase-like protein